MSLLDRCVCGAHVGAEILLRGELTVVRCSCGVGRLLTDATRAQVEEQYLGQYHEADDRHEGCVPYAKRYSHDMTVAAVRGERYRLILAERFESVRNSLDVGASNGAFVDYMRAIGIQSVGIDPDPSMRSKWVVNCSIADESILDVAGGLFDLVTMHDVLEHLVYPEDALHRAGRLLSPGGLLIVDVPDVWGGSGDHHFKAEHLWYFTDESVKQMAVEGGLNIIAVDRPIPGKLVVYCEGPK